MIVACPDPEVLRRLLLGQVPAEELDTIASHVETCSSCIGRLHAQQASDPLLEAMQQAASNPFCVDDPQMQQWMRQQVAGLADTVSRSGSTVCIGAPTGGDTEGLPELAPPQQPDEIGRLGDYRILQLLGSGGMGIVFRAEDVRLKRTVALKVMKPDVAGTTSARERFLREAQSAAALDHENIVTIHQVGEERGVPFLAMQWLKGTNLDDHLKQARPLPTAEVAQVGRQIALGLAAAHEQGLIHRDIKPGNIWLERKDESGRLPPSSLHVKLLDFGLARTLADDVQLTQSGTIVGTPAYMAPEQARGLKVDHHSDLFSLGVVLYRMATGQLPFRGEGTMAVLTSLAMDVPTAPHLLNRDVPAELSDLIVQLLEKDPARRPASAREVAARLSNIVQLADRTPPTEPTEALQAPARMREMPGRSLLAASLAAAALLVAAGVFFLQTRNGTIRVEVLDDKIDARLSQGKLHVTGHDAKEIAIEPGDQKLKVSRDGFNFETPQFTLKRGDKITFQVTWIDGKIQVTKDGQLFDSQAPLAASVVATDPDRKAAEYALSIGGLVHVNGEARNIVTAADLPKEPFRLTSVKLDGFRQVTDESLAHFKDCTDLSGLGLWGTQVSDTGLTQLKDCKNLVVLNLAGTKVSDAGLAQFKDCKNMAWLELSNTQVADAGLAPFEDHRFIAHLYLRNTKIGDVGLAHVKRIKSLTTLDVRGTKVTAQALAEFHSAVPGCKIEHDGGVIQPTVAANPDRQAAEYVLSIGGTVRVNSEPSDIQAAAALPKEPFRLTWVWLNDNKKVDDAGLAWLKDCRYLTVLSLKGTGVSDSGLDHLQGITTLFELHLESTQVTDKGLAAFRDCKNLTHLFLGNTAVTDAGLIHFRDCKNLQWLSLWKTGNSDVGLEYFKDCQYLRGVYLLDTRVGDASLTRLIGMKNLLELDVRKTKVTSASLASFHAGIPGCRINSDGGMIEPTSADPDRRAAEYVLSIGGLVRVNGERDIKGAVDLPREPFRLTSVGLDGNKRVTDAGLADLKGCKHLWAIGLSGTGITDPGLANVEGSDLVVLSLAGTRVTDAGLARFSSCRNLAYLNLDVTQVTNEGLAHFKESRYLRTLLLAFTRIGDAELAHFVEWKNLTQLNVKGTRVTADGVQKLAAALPACKIIWDGGTIEPRATPSARE